MTKSELLEQLEDLIIVSFKQRETVDLKLYPEKYGFFDGKIFAFKLIRDFLFYSHVVDDMEVLDLFGSTEIRVHHGNEEAPEK